MGFLLLVPLILICFVWQNESIPVHSQQHSEGAVYISAGVCVVFLVVLVLGLLLIRRKYFLEVVIQQWAGYVKSQPWEMPYISSVSWGQADVSAWLCCSCLPGSPAQCLGQLPAWSHHLRHHSYQLTWGLMRRCAIQSHIPFPARFLMGTTHPSAATLSRSFPMKKEDALVSWSYIQFSSMCQMFSLEALG